MYKTNQHGNKKCSEYYYFNSVKHSAIMIVKIFLISFRVFVCSFPPGISSIFGKSFPFPFPHFVLSILWYFHFHVINNQVIYNAKSRWIKYQQTIYFCYMYHLIYTYKTYFWCKTFDQEYANYMINERILTSIIVCKKSTSEIYF